MPQEPKKRHSRQRQGKRRSAIHLSIPALTNCQNCGKSIIPHTVCPNCGYYKGKDVLNLSKKTPKTKHLAKTSTE